MQIISRRPVVSFQARLKVLDPMGIPINLGKGEEELKRAIPATTCEARELLEIFNGFDSYVKVADGTENDEVNISCDKGELNVWYSYKPNGFIVFDRSSKLVLSTKDLFARLVKCFEHLKTEVNAQQEKCV